MGSNGLAERDVKIADVHSLVAVGCGPGHLSAVVCARNGRRSWVLHRAELLLALCHACQHRACLLAPCGSQRTQSSVLTSLSPVRHVRTCLAAVGDVSWVQVLAKA